MCNSCAQNNQPDCVLDQIVSTRDRADVEAITRCLEEVKQELALIKVRAKPARYNKAPDPCLGKTANPVNTHKTPRIQRELRRHALPWHPWRQDSDNKRTI